MAVTSKGKQATKGQKQIYVENEQTIKYYFYMSSISTIIYLGLMLFCWPDLFFTFKYILAFLCCSLIHGLSLAMMRYMAKPVFNSSGVLVDGGIDLNMEQGIAEYFKDLIILNSIIQTLSMISNYFWLAWFLALFYALFLLWTNILGPWFFAPAPEEEPISEKKQRKLDRKMRRTVAF
ncbi:Transmembrane protein [Sarcoptes scabiei]|uniref:Transmembrane protein 208 n=1 Tax=Sarcoptes scabiei TaxID=52283 RepID=A0A834VDN8_SARSC|nr:Transmembrane protein [Sarcoptes scabiei]